jgi:hypothetical protein
MQRLTTLGLTFSAPVPLAWAAGQEHLYRLVKRLSGEM